MSSDSAMRVYTIVYTRPPLEWPVYTSTSPSLRRYDRCNSLLNQKITKSITKVSLGLTYEQSNYLYQASSEESHQFRSLFR